MMRVDRFPWVATNDNCYCTLLVHISGPPWPNPVFVPRASSIIIDCMTTEDSDTFWGVYLANDSVQTEIRFHTAVQEAFLNAHGVYQLSGSPPVLSLMINDTAINNQTSISCARFIPSQTKSETRLFLYGMLY